MSELNNIIANYSHVLENSHATLRACEEFERDRARIENLIPLRVHRNRTEYSTLSAEDLVKHKESLLEGIFDDHVFGQVRSKLSYEASEVKTVAFLGDPRVTGVTLYLPKPIVKLVDTEEDNDYETARTYHHDIIDQTLETHLFTQAKVSQISADYPYSFLGDTVVNLVGLLTTKMRMLASVVSAKETFVASALENDIQDILKVYDGIHQSLESARSMGMQDSQVEGVLAEVDEPARAMSLEWIKDVTNEHRARLKSKVVDSINRDTPAMPQAQVNAQAEMMTQGRLHSQWSDEGQYQKTVDCIEAYFTENPPSDDHAATVDLSPIIIGLSLRDGATDMNRATDPNGVKTVLTTGGEEDWSLESFLPPSFGELLSDSQE
jgi:hypothetical protein